MYQMSFPQEYTKQIVPTEETVTLHATAPDFISGLENILAQLATSEFAANVDEYMAYATAMLRVDSQIFDPETGTLLIDIDTTKSDSRFLCLSGASFLVIEAAGETTIKLSAHKGKIE